MNVHDTAIELVYLVVVAQFHLLIQSSLAVQQQQPPALCTTWFACNSLPLCMYVYGAVWCVTRSLLCGPDQTALPHSLAAHMSCLVLLLGFRSQSRAL